MEPHGVFTEVTKSCTNNDHFCLATDYTCATAASLEAIARTSDRFLTLIKGMPLHCSGSEESLTGKLLSPLDESL